MVFLVKIFLKNFFGRGNFKKENMNNSVVGSIMEMWRDCMFCLEYFLLSMIMLHNRTYLSIEFGTISKRL